VIKAEILKVTVFEFL